MSISLPAGSRRDFLKTVGITSALALPTLIPSTVLAAPGRTGANGKIRAGLIGAGTRARWLSRSISRESDRAELVAVCDCYLPQVDKLAADYRESVQAKPRWTAYQNYEEMYDREDLDAVMIATPDHVRVRAAILACVRGLDIYAEKPLSFSIPEGRALVKAVRKHQRVLQVGTQQRSTNINLYACKFVRDGGLGKVDTILVKNMSGSRPVQGLDPQAIPEGMDWNRFCAQAPLLDYHSDLPTNGAAMTPSQEARSVIEGRTLSIWSTWQWDGKTPRPRGSSRPSKQTTIGSAESDSIIPTEP
jgi:hypothetical protein